MSKVLFNIAFTSKSVPRYLKPDKKAGYIQRRAFYDMTAKYNYFEYMLNDKKVVKNKDMFEYMLNPDKHDDSSESTGAFNMQGEISHERLDELREQLKNTQSNIWHGFISFDAEASLGMTTQQKAQKFLKQSFNAFLERTHLNASNIELVATLHDNTDNRHIHFTFFEKKPKRRNSRGELCYTNKGTFDNAVLENYLVSANMHMSDHCYEYYTARDRAMRALKALRADAKGDKLSAAELRAHLRQLKAKLPSTGRLQYNAENLKPLRRDIDEVAELLIRHNPEAAAADRAFRAALAQKEQEARDICTAPVTKRLDMGEKQLKYVNNRELNSKEVQQLLHEGKTEYIRANKINWDNIDYFERLRQDYKARCGNQVLGLIKDMERDFAKKNRPTYNDKQRKIQARIKRRESRAAVRAFMNTLGSYQRGLQTDFSKSLKQIEHEMQAQRMQENA